MIATAATVVGVFRHLTPRPIRARATAPPAIFAAVFAAVFAAASATRSTARSRPGGWIRRLSPTSRWVVRAVVVLVAAGFFWLATPATAAASSADHIQLTPATSAGASRSRNPLLPDCAAARWGRRPLCDGVTTPVWPARVPGSLRGPAHAESGDLSAPVHACASIVPFSDLRTLPAWSWPVCRGVGPRFICSQEEFNGYIVAIIRSSGSVVAGA
jgi:hypothetical protein